MDLDQIIAFFLTQLYTRFAFAYDLVATLVSNGRWNKWVTCLLDQIEGPTVLELGHGPGHLLLELQHKGLVAYGIDPSPSMGRLTRNRLASHSFHGNIVFARAQQLPFSENSFHQVVTTFPTSYIGSAHTIREIWRVLIHQGSILIILAARITGRSAYDKIAQWLFRTTKQDVLPSAHFNQLFESAGFCVQTRQVEIDNSIVYILKATKP